MTAPKRARRDKRLGVTLLAGTGVAIGAIGAGLAAWLLGRRSHSGEGHAAPDLAGEERPAPQDRAVPDFRPDPTARVTAAEREALRPATMPVPPASVSDPTVEQLPAIEPARRATVE